MTPGCRSFLREAIVGLMQQDELDLSVRALAVLLICYLDDAPHTARATALRPGVSSQP